MSDERELSDAELEELDRSARESLDDRANRNLGSVARDRTIRRLIQEVRRARGKGRAAGRLEPAGEER